MTTVQSMLWKRMKVRVLVAAGLAVLGSLPAGCTRAPELVAPEVLVSPYDTAGADVLWAVAPLVNESGTSAVDPLAVSDQLVAKITEVEGLACVPMNRTLAAMRELGIPGVRSGVDARWLADMLGADAIVVGTITAYDPYNPPKIGLALALFARDPTATGRPASESIDPRALQRSFSDGGPVPGGRISDRPVAVISEELEGANHAVQMSVKRYAEGRHSPTSALGWKRYLASMDLYTEFASYWTVKRLLDEERMRLAKPAGEVVSNR